ncbi:MAG: alpha/beta hydrolase, partial [Verrucomicrobiota bacterium]
DWRALGYESGTMKAIWDNIRGIDLLESLPFVKRGGVAAIGHSLGGHNSIYTAAFDSRIKVIVSSCGFDSYLDYQNGNITGWTSIRYMPKLLEYPLTEIPFDFHEMIASLAPRAVFVNAPQQDTNFKWQSVDHVAAVARKIYRLYGAENNLRVAHPDCGHDFPDEIRAEAYQFISEHLK